MSVFLLACVLWGVGDLQAEPPGPGPICRDIEAQLRTILTSSALEGAKVGLVVQDLRSRVVLFEQDADQLLIPASNIKLLTDGGGFAVSWAPLPI